jgi:predicted membrane chloride channel (bestrophin family)
MFFARRIPFTVVLSFFLLGIEELGIQLEEPFSVLPLHKITSGIGLSAEEHVQWFLVDEDKDKMEKEKMTNGFSRSTSDHNSSFRP